MNYFDEEDRRPHPKRKTNVISDIFFVFALNFLIVKRNHDLREQDLYEVLPGYKSQKLGNRIEKIYQNGDLEGKKLTAGQLLLRCYGFPYFLIGLASLLYQLIDILVVPYFLGKFVSHFTKGDASRTDVYFNGGILTIVLFLLTVYNNNWMLIADSFGLKVRAGICSFLYRKILRLNPSGLSKVPIGNIITVMTKDVEVFEICSYFGNDLWVAPIKTIVIAYFFYKRIGVAGLVGIGFDMVLLLVQVYLGIQAFRLRLKMCKRTDKRMEVTKEALSMIKTIKYFVWEDIFFGRIINARKKEAAALYIVNIWKYFLLSVATLTTRFSLLLTLICYVWIHGHITAEIFFYIVATSLKLSITFNIMFTAAIRRFADFVAVSKRINDIVQNTEIQTEAEKHETDPIPRIIFNNVTVTIGENVVLKDLFATIENGLTIITGPVASGKSVFLRTILRNYTPVRGDLQINGRISYASQDPWLFPSTIKQNILFGTEFNAQRYKNVIKACALYHDFQIFENGDDTIVEDSAINLSKGQQIRVNLARAAYQDSDICLLDDPLAGLDYKVANHIFDNCIKGFLRGRLVVLATQNTQHATRAESIIQLGRYQTSEISKHSLVAAHSKAPDGLSTLDDIQDCDEETHLLSQPNLTRKVYREEKATGSVSFETYNKFIKFGGGYCLLIFIIALSVCTQFTYSASSKIVSIWANIEVKFPNSTESLYSERRLVMYKLGGLAFGGVITFLGQEALLLVFCRIAADKFHKNMIISVIKGSLEFFDYIFIGNILNRLSKDLTVLDEYLAIALHFVIYDILEFVGVLVLIASVSSSFLIIIFLFVVALIIITKLFLPTTNNLKRLEALTKSPLIGQLSATLEGLTTVKASGVEAILLREFDKHQDNHVSASYMYLSSLRGYVFLTHIVSNMFLACAVLKFLLVDVDTSSGDIGLVLSQILLATSRLNTTLVWWTRIENYMTSVERSLEYAQIKKETEEGQTFPAWPRKGTITFKNVSLIYPSDNKPSLRNLNFSVNHNEKIGIVGRTGAGKSSLISTLFRFYDFDGNVFIDGVCTKSLKLSHLRSKIAIVSQDCSLFTGTLRENIDPLNAYSDENIWKVIESVNLKRTITDLNMEIVDFGASFSVGERQLICLARAMMQKSRIIVLDEVTASIDEERESLIEQVIEKYFVDCTVIVITHKLHTARKCDRIMVIDGGEVVKFDKPSVLLRDDSYANTI